MQWRTGTGAALLVGAAACAGHSDPREECEATAPQMHACTYAGCHDYIALYVDVPTVRGDLAGARLHLCLQGNCVDGDIPESQEPEEGRPTVCDSPQHGELCVWWTAYDNTMQFLNVELTEDRHRPRPDPEEYLLEIQSADGVSFVHVERTIYYAVNSPNGLTCPPHCLFGVDRIVVP